MARLRTRCVPPRTASSLRSDRLLRPLLDRHRRRRDRRRRFARVCVRWKAPRETPSSASRLSLRRTPRLRPSESLRLFADVLKDLFGRGSWVAAVDLAPAALLGRQFECDDRDALVMNVRLLETEIRERLRFDGDLF